MRELFEPREFFREIAASLSLIPGTQKRLDVSFLISLSIRIICVVYLQQDGVLDAEADEEDSSPPPSLEPKLDSDGFRRESAGDGDDPASVSEVR